VPADLKSSQLETPFSVVVTRPRAQLLPLLDQLDEKTQSAGIATRLYPLPLLEIECALPHEKVSNLNEAMVQADLIIFVSPNAILMTYQLLRDAGLDWPPNKTIGLMGGGSESALLDLKVQAKKIIKPLNPLQWDAQGLWEELQSEFTDWAGKRVVFIRGQGGRHSLIDHLQEAHAQLEVFEVYRRTPLSTNDFFWLSVQDGLQFIKSLQQLPQSPWLWILTSSEAVRTIPQAFKELNIPLDMLSSFHALCSHPNIAKAAKEVGFGNIHSCLAGDEQLVEATILWIEQFSK
jgi:uroporphyrinogen-III synthase